MLNLVLLFMLDMQSGGTVEPLEDMLRSCVLS